MGKLATAVSIFTLLAAPALAQVSDGLVRIGILNDQSGPFADLGGRGSVIAAQLAVEDFGGSVLGKPVEVIVGDHQNKPDIASAIARRWIDTEKVDALVDLPVAATAFAVQNITKEKNRMLLLSSAGSADFTGKACTATTIQWTFDTYAMANGTARALVQQGGTTWFFLTGDSAGHHSQEKDATDFVKKAGGTVVGSARHPMGTHDFSSFVLQAQSSGAKIIGLANAGNDAVNALKQGVEFGLTQGGKQRFAALLMFISEIHAIGLQGAQGLLLTDAFYWDMDDKTRAWSKRFMERSGGRAPTSVQAGVYGAVLHYLKAIKQAGTDESLSVANTMKEMPVNDFWSDNYRIRKDGRLVRDMYLFEVKRPEESKYPWDYYKMVARVPGDQAFRPMSEGGCPLVN